MTTMSIQLPETLHDRVENIAQQEGMSINQFVISAVTDKIAIFLKTKFWNQAESDDVQKDNQIESADAISNGQTEVVKDLSNQEKFNMAMLSIMADKTLFQAHMNKLLSAHSIECEPIGVKALQERMKSANLMPNELSQSIIMARDE